MKKFALILVIIFTLNVAVFTLPSLADENTDKIMADKLFTMLDRSEKSLTEAFALYDAQKYIESIDAYKVHFVDAVRSIDLREFSWHNTYVSSAYYSNVFVWMGDMTTEEFTAKYPGRALVEETRFGLIAKNEKDLKLNWLATDDSGRAPEQMWLRWITCFQGAYWVTKNPDILKRYFYVINDFALNFRKQAITIGSSNVYQSWTFNNGFTFGSMARTENVIKQLAATAKMLPSDADFPTWANVLKPIGGTVTPEGYKMFDSRALVNFIFHTLDEINPYFLKFYIEPGAAPNQRLGGLGDLMMETALFPEFKIIKEVVAPNVEKGISSFLSGSTHPDGASMEQAFNYNKGDEINFNFFKNLYEKKEVKPSFYNLLVNKAEYSGRVLKYLQKPDGSEANVGGGSYNYTKRLWIDSEAEAWGKQNAANFASNEGFLSIAYPYAGYYAMRNGWGMKDTYMFMQNTRPSRGHYYSAQGSVDLYTKGRPMLIAFGYPHYFYTDVPAELGTDAQRMAYREKFSSYFGEIPNFTRNVVLVNNYPQASSGKNGQYLTDISSLDTIKNLWHDTDSFGFMQSTWEGGYSDHQNRDDKKVDNVSHKRDVIYIKEIDSFILTDALYGGESNDSYQQIWNFMPYYSKADGDPIDVQSGFRDKDILTKDNSIYTQDPNGPNVFLNSFCNSNLKYIRYFGYDGEMGLKGWFSGGIGGYRYPKTDIYVDWKNSPTLSPLTTLITTSNNTQSVAKDLTDISTSSAGQSGFTGTVDGAKITFVSYKEPSKITNERISGKAKTVLIVEKDGKKKGIVSGAKNITIDGTLIETNYENYEYDLSSGTLSIKSINYPTSFAWIEGENGKLTPTYKLVSTNEVNAMVQKMKDLSNAIYPVKFYLKRYMNEKIDLAPKVIDDAVNILQNCAVLYDGQRTLLALEELFAKLIDYRATLQGAEKEKENEFITVQLKKLEKAVVNTSDQSLTEYMVKTITSIKGELQ